MSLEYLGICDSCGAMVWWSEDDRKIVTDCHPAYCNELDNERVRELKREWEGVSNDND